MNVFSENSKSELHISAKPVIAALLVVGMALVFLNDPGSSTSGYSQTTIFALFFYVLAVLVWVSHRWKTWLGKWVTILGLASGIVLAHIWLGVPGILALLVIPIGLAVAVSGFFAAVITAVGETVLLLLLGMYITPAIDWTFITIAVVAIWAMLSTMYAACTPAYRIAELSSEYYNQTQTLLNESRERKAELARALEDLAHANRQLALTNERMATLRAMAETARESKAAFVARVSHEFRTPLNIIIGMVNLMVESPEVYAGAFPPKAFEHLKIVYRNTEHLAGMIDDVLDLSQADAGQLHIQRELVDLTEVIRSSIAVVQSLLEQKQLQLKVALPDDLPGIYCDRLRIRQVILNLLSNAARFTEKGGVTIEVVRQEQSVLVNVADTGPGISPEDTQRIFQPFFQTRDEPWHDGKGSGLGLSISKQFVELHGGRMWLESQLGTGTTFHIELPISPPAPLLTLPQHRIHEEWSWHERPSHASLPPEHYRPRIVVYDETAELCPALGRLTDEIEFAGYSDQRIAMQEAQQSSARALFINASSPGGLLALVDQARREIGDMPIIGCCYPSKKERALKAGIADYLLKPVTRADLERAIEQIGKPIQRVLIVDDDSDVREVFSLFIRAKDDSVTIFTAENGEQALEALHSHVPDLMILDVMMPDMNGWRVLEAKAVDKEIRDIPTIMLSARDIEGPRESEVFVATMGDGLSLSKFLDCSRDLWTRLLQP